MRRSDWRRHFVLDDPRVAQIAWHIPTTGPFPVGIPEFYLRQERAKEGTPALELVQGQGRAGRHFSRNVRIS